METFWCYLFLISTVSKTDVECKFLIISLKKVSLDVILPV